MVVFFLMWSAIDQSPFIQAFSQVVTQESSILFEGLWDAPKAILLLKLIEVTRKNLLILSGGERQARLLDDLAFFGTYPILSLPAWETLPTEDIPPSADIVGCRFETLHTLLTQQGPHIITAPLQGVLQKVCCLSSLADLFLTWKKGSHFAFDSLPTLLTRLGYRREAVACDKGEFAIRGGILDIFPVSAYDPYRVDFFDDEIDQIRTYDPISQKSIERKENLFISPAQELRLLQEEKELCSIFDYLGDQTVVVFDDVLALEDAYVSFQKLQGFLSRFFLSFAQFDSQAKAYQRIYFTQNPIEDFSSAQKDVVLNSLEKEDKKLSFELLDHVIETKRLPHSFRSLSDDMWKQEEDRVQAALSYGEPHDFFLVCASQSEKKALQEKMGKFNRFFPEKHILDGTLSSGFELSDQKIIFCPYSELMKRPIQSKRMKWRNTHHTPTADFHALSPGDLVVHFHSGIGRFLGIESKVNHLGNQEEFLMIEYAEKSKLYVPLYQSHLVSRYIGARDELPSLHKLGTKKWQRAKEQAQKAIIGYAKDLLDMQAQRLALGGTALPPDSLDMQLFEESFPFTETADQLEAIAAVKKDMESSQAMDRLICGDVGYGKTEIAMRAAFKAVCDGHKQVAVLVPTTVLAMQHYETFVQRMADFPIAIGVASRFVKPKKLKETLAQIAKGTIDIIIGTHRLISQDVQFNNLGLIIIDEEQRFGVRAKERLKKTTIGVDCLTLSATPIPRTLYFSLIGARDMSLINMPPQDRLPIKTILAEKDDELIKNALLRELSRDGQAYVIHNRVETIFKIAEQIKALVPEAQIGTVHGQMETDAIDRIFHAFKKGEIDILVATTLIENGVDIPNANTMIIDRADCYGLADLYQLRGRVGRWNRPAYAYFLTPRSRVLPEIAQKRLQALVETSGFGGGIKLAMRDLEMRGAGDMLGTRQKGNVATIGFHFYCKLLKRAVEALKKEEIPSFFDVRLEYTIGAYLPSFYIVETNLRLELYHRLGEIYNYEEIDGFFNELIDRFGPLPEQAKWLYHLSRLRVFAAQYRFSLLKFEKTTLFVKRKVGSKEIERHFSLFHYLDPQDLENKTTSLLKQHFALS